MNIIKFSHVYEKMPTILNPTFIREVEVKHYKDLDAKFIEEDTAIKGGESYELPKTKLIVIYLLTGKHKWTTIRRWTPKKAKYYQDLVGQQVKIRIEEK